MNTRKKERKVTHPKWRRSWHVSLNLYMADVRQTSDMIGLYQSRDPTGALHFARCDLSPCVWEADPRLRLRVGFQASLNIQLANPII